MDQRFKDFLDNLVYWLERDHEIEADYVEVGENEANINLYSEGEEFRIGTFEDPGIHAKWLGTHWLDDEPEDLVKINGLIFSALGRQVAGWAVGL